MRTEGTAPVGGSDDRRLTTVDAAGGFGVSALLCDGAVIQREDDDADVDQTTTTTTNKKGANMTERVPVPSSEHVAEIVGRQGRTYLYLVYLY